MSISSTKTDLAEAIELYDQLKLKLNDQGDLSSFSEEEWQSRIRSLGLDTVDELITRLIQDLSSNIHNLS